MCRRCLTMNLSVVAASVATHWTSIFSSTHLGKDDKLPISKESYKIKCQPFRDGNHIEIPLYCTMMKSMFFPYSCWQQIIFSSWCSTTCWPSLGSLPLLTWRICTPSTSNPIDAKVAVIPPLLSTLCRCSFLLKHQPKVFLVCITFLIFKGMILYIVICSRWINGNILKAAVVFSARS